MPEFITTRKLREIIDNAPAGISARDITMKLVEQGYELEGLNTEFSPLEAVKNIPGSTVEFGKAIWMALSKPGQTVKGLSTVALGGIQDSARWLGLQEGEISDPEKAWRATINFFVDRYGGKDRILNTIEQDPVGFLSDASTFVTGAGAIVGGIGKVSKVGKLTTIGKGVVKTGRLLEPTMVAQKALQVGIVKPTKLFNKATGMEQFFAAKAGEFAEKALNISPSAGAKLAHKTFKKPPGEVLAEFGIHGTLDEMGGQLATLARRSKTLLDEGLADIPTTYRNATTRKTLKLLIDGLSDVQSSELLATRRKLTGYLIKHDQTKIGLTLSEMNETKRILDAIDSPFKSTAEISGIGTVDFAKSSVAAMDVKNLRQRLQTFIENKAADHGFKNVRELNKRTVFGTEGEKLVKDAALSLKGKKAFIDSLILQAGLAGSIFTADAQFILAAAGVTVARRYVQSPRFRSAVAAKMMTWSDRDVSALRQFISTKKPTPVVNRLIRESFRDLRIAFPEIRLVGVVSHEYGY